MSLFDALILGILQGATELLPVSSSGHLVLARWALGWEGGNADVDKAFDVAVHVGTLLAVVVLLRADIVRIVRETPASIARRAGSDPLPRLLLLATVPAAITGALLEDVIVERASEPWLIAVMLIVFGLVLAVADRSSGEQELDALDRGKAVWVGVAQAAALQPGVSRSGATIAMARLLGLAREDAARLSFLLSIPLITGAGVFEAIKLVGSGVESSFLGAAAVGASAAAATAAGSILLVLRVAQRWSFMPFVVYRVALGIAVLIALAVGWR